MAIKHLLCNTGSWVKRGATVAALGLVSVILTACGGGGAQGGDPTAPGTPLAILPADGSMYATVPQLLTIAGGRPPYFVSSNEPSIIGINNTINGNVFTVVPNQPGVFDPNEDANAVPRRQVVLTVRDSTGTQVAGTYGVLQNFLTGYSLNLTSLVPCGTSSTTPGAAPAAVQACAGTESIIRLVPVFNGLRFANKQMRFTVNFGAFAFVLDSVGNTGGTLVATADSSGIVTARIRVLQSAITQYAQFRLADVATGSYSDQNFVITNQSGSTTALSALPSSITLSGATTATCGTGTVNLFIFGGQPPYTASVTFPNSMQVSPPILTRSGDAFTVSLNNPNFCLAPGSVVVTDAAGARVTVDVTTSVGTATPVIPLTVAPTTLACLPNGGSASVVVSGGSATKVINSSDASLVTSSPTTLAADGTITINGVGAPPVAGTTVTLSVTDGRTTSAISVFRKATCP